MPVLWTDEGVILLRESFRRSLRQQRSGSLGGEALLSLRDALLQPALSGKPFLLPIAKTHAHRLAPGRRITGLSTTS